MATPPSLSAIEARRRLVLVDFDWQDADLVPELLRQPGVSIRLVAGSQPEEAGIRLAEICGLPRTLDLADLTREIFDLALVSERSPRRTQIEGLLLALGTPSVTPQSFVWDGADPVDLTPGVQAPLELHAAAFETTLGGEDFDALVERALPDLSPDAPTEPKQVQPRGTAQLRVPNLEDFPSLEDRLGLEGALRDLMSDTGAGRAELHLDGPEAMEMVVGVGTEDRLLEELIRLALELGSPQVVSCLTGPNEGKAWGAWPFQTAQRRGVLAAGGIDPATAWTVWQSMIEEFRAKWDERDREKAGAAFPLVPVPQPGWLGATDFTARLDLALERNRRDGLRFTLHRLDFPASTEAVERLATRLPDQLRDTDSICRPSPTRVLLLTASPRDRFPYLRRRIANVWQEAWLEVGNERPILGFSEDRLDLTGPTESESFRTRATDWMADS